MTGVQGAVTAAYNASPAQFTLPDSKITLIGCDAYGNSASGVLALNLDATRQAQFPFMGTVGVTTADVPVLPVGPYNFTHSATGLQLNFSATGFSAGTLIIYYGTPFSGSVPLAQWAGIQVSFTTGTSLSFTFPSGTISLTGASIVFGTSNAQTGTSIQDSFNTSAGRSVTLNFSINQYNGLQQRAMIILDNIVAAQTLTVTQAYSTTHVGTGYLVLYYK